MRTLYVRFVVVTICIMMLSSVLAFLLSNVCYHAYLKPYNDDKVTNMLKQVQRYVSVLSYEEAAAYLQNTSSLGYQLYIADREGAGQFYGAPFRGQKMSSPVIEQVQSGEIYHGIRQQPYRLFLTGFFENELMNSIGVPVTIEGKTYALFMRPDIQKQFWEMRIFFSLLLVGTIVFSMIFVAISTRYIVKPIRIFTQATKKIADGQYNIQLDVQRKDEIGTLAQHFSKMAESLNRLEQMRQEFVSNVSHELQSPLTSIQGYAQILRSQQLPLEQKNHYLSIIEEESRRLSLLSKQMLTLAALDQEDAMTDVQSFQIAEQLQQVVKATEWQWREKELAIELDVEAAFVTGNKDLLYQAWTNLITNSIKFTDFGGTISIETDASSSSYSITIADTGIGIGEEDLQRIFEPYYKGDKSRNRERGGSGLGLAITKKIITLHGGTIDVKSQLGVGTQFSVTLSYL